MEYPIRVVQYGLGPIGMACARTVVAKQASGLVELVGAIDVSPDLVGEDVGTLIGSPRPLGVTVSADADQVFKKTRPHVALHTTTSFLERAYQQLEACADHGVNVVSSSEELFYPFLKQPEISTRIDQLARRHGIAILGTGVNPGFVMDTLALSVTSMCTVVRGLKANRVVDAAHRRLPLQKKIGAGLSTEEFNARKQTGTFGHIGLIESLHFVAAGLGWRLERVDEQLDPVLASTDVQTPFLRVAAGQVAGIHHQAHGYIDGRSVVSLDLKMYVGAGESVDEVLVEGEPPLHVRVPGGIFGDTATVAAVVNAIPIIVSAAPGLHTTAGLPLPRAFANPL